MQGLSRHIDVCRDLKVIQGQEVKNRFLRALFNEKQFRKYNQQSSVILQKHKPICDLAQACFDPSVHDHPCTLALTSRVTVAFLLVYTVHRVQLLILLGLFLLLVYTVTPCTTIDIAWIILIIILILIILRPESFLYGFEKLAEQNDLKIFTHVRDHMSSSDRNLVDLGQ